MADTIKQANELGYVQSADGYWYHKDWKGQPGWEDRPWLDTAEEVLEYEAINTTDEGQDRESYSDTQDRESYST